jgi:hypothetical protein
MATWDVFAITVLFFLIIKAMTKACQQCQGWYSPHSPKQEPGEPVANQTRDHHSVTSNSKCKQTDLSHKGVNRKHTRCVSSQELSL